jgi:hypothetical protein
MDFKYFLSLIYLKSNVTDVVLTDMFSRQNA